MELAAIALLLMSVIAHAQTSAPPSKLPAVTTAHGGPSDLLAAVPADTIMMVSFRDLAGLDRKLMGIMQQVGFPGSPFQLAKGTLQMVEGFDDHGSAALVILAASEPTPPSKRMAILLPTKDRTKLLQYVKPRVREDGLVEVTIKGLSSFAGTKGKFTVVGENPDTVKKIIANRAGIGERFTAHQRIRFAKNDISWWANPAAIATASGKGKLKPWLQNKFGISSEALQALQQVQWSLRFEPDGMAMELYTGSNDRTKPAPSRDTEVSLLKGLPAEPFILATGFMHKTQPGEATDLVDGVIASLIAAGILDRERATPLRERWKLISRDIVSGAASISLLPSGPGGLIGQAKVLTLRSDSRSFMEGLDAIVETLKSGPFVDPRYNTAAGRIEHRRAVETAEGVTIDHLVVDLDGLAGVDVGAIKKVVGQEGLLWRIGAIDNRRVVITFGGGIARFKAVAAEVRTDRASLSTVAGIMASGQGVSEVRFAEAYFALDRANKLVRDACRAVDVSPWIPAMPELNAPVALAVHDVEPGAVQVDVFLPNKLVKAIIESALLGIVSQMEFGSR